MYNELKVIWADFPDEFCFYGMKVSKLQIGTSQGFVDAETPYTTELGIGTFLIIIFLITFIGKKLPKI